MAERGQWPKAEVSTKSGFDNEEDETIQPLAIPGIDNPYNGFDEAQLSMINNGDEIVDNIKKKFTAGMARFNEAFDRQQSEVELTVDTMNQLSATINKLRTIISGLKMKVLQLADSGRVASETADLAVLELDQRAASLDAIGNDLKRRRTEIVQRQTTRPLAAGDFFVDQRFVPGKRENAEPGEYITPHTLLKYMRRWRKALKRDDVSEFTPYTVGYIPFTEIGNGLVHVDGGVDLEEIDKGKPWKFQNKGCMKSLDHQSVQEIYYPAVKQKQQSIRAIENSTSEMKKARKVVV